MAESIMLDKAKDFATGYIYDEQYKTIINNCGQIRRMLISSINTVKEKDKGE